MKPTIQPGFHTFRTVEQSGAQRDVTYFIDSEGIHTTFGILIWDQAGDCYKRGSIAMSFSTQTTGVGVNGAENYAWTMLN